MRSFANPVVGYVGAVLGVMAIASVAVFTLHAMAAKAHRHWDADIDRIIAQQQAKKLETAVLARAEIPDESNIRPQIAALTRGAIEEDEDELAFSNEEAKSKKLQNPGGKKYSRRADRRRQHYVPTAFVTVPNSPPPPRPAPPFCSGCADARLYDLLIIDLQIVSQ